MNVLINKAHFPVTVLGHGNRVGIWFQGCSIGCKNCCSLDTWDFSQDRSIDVRSLIEWCKESTGGALDGVTISGGEPFDQPAGLMVLLLELEAWRTELDRPLDILVYSGRSATSIRRSFQPHLELIDTVVAGPFMNNKPTSKAWCGSDNQELMIQSELGRSRYGDGDGALKQWKTGIQVTTDNTDIWMIGIPKPTDLEKLEARCRQKGLEMGLVSWRS